MKNIYSILLFSFIIPFSWSQDLPSPKEFLGYDLGSKFTFHHRIVDYVEHIAEQSANAKLIPYGKTYEGRPLMVVVLTDEENMPILDDIRLANVLQTGLVEGETSVLQKPIVWLSYNVHGNEAVSSEAIMETLYLLATGQAQGSADWMKDMILVLDPCINPDGRDRYANWYNQYQNSSPNVHSDSWEHNEPWPGGRVNHYLFDLNRDWAWQSQVESQQRMKLIQQWMPHVHVDFHEMGPNSPYYFAPAARPYHEVITDWQVEFQELVGKNHAKYFDQAGWRYFTKESFDLFYPSYGDTWPVYNGGIGMTYEQGGSGRAGLGVIMDNGDTLTLKDRIDHHVTTGLSTIETSWTHKDRLLSNFNNYFEQGKSDPTSEYKSYVIKASNDPHRVQALLDLLKKQQIQFGFAETGRKSSYVGFRYRNNGEETFSLDEQDIVVSAYQPLSRFVQVLMEPQGYLEDSLTYDLTAWSLPYAYGMDVYACKDRINTNAYTKPSFTENPTPKADSYAIIVDWKDVQHVKFLAAISKKGIQARYAELPFRLQGKDHDKGSILVMRADNMDRKTFAMETIQIANSLELEADVVEGGFVESGKDLGSRRFPLIKKPKVALIGGSGTRSGAYGEIWHYFEQVLNYPITNLNSDYASRIDLSSYNVVILGAGSYGKFQQKLLDFVRNGGKVIALESAIETFASAITDGKGSTELAQRIFNEKKNKLDLNIQIADPEKMLKKYGDRERSRAMSMSAGSVYKVDLDESHPLAHGLGKQLHLLKRNSRTYPYLKRGWNVGSFQPGAHRAGFAGANLKKKLAHSLAIGEESLGRGKIIYMTDSPIFRAFWHEGKLLMGNAVFLD